MQFAHRSLAEHDPKHSKIFLLYVGVEVWKPFSISLEIFMFDLPNSKLFSVWVFHFSCMNLQPYLSNGQETPVTKYLHNFTDFTLCIFMCFCNLHFVRNTLSHSPHSNRFSLPWVASIWSSRSQYRWNVRLQNSQVTVELWPLSDFSIGALSTLLPDFSISFPRTSIFLSITEIFSDSSSFLLSETSAV